MGSTHTFLSPREVTTGSIEKGDDHVVGEGDDITLSTEITNNGNTCLKGTRVRDDRNSAMVCKPPYSGEPLRFTQSAHGKLIATRECDIVTC